MQTSQASAAPAAVSARWNGRSAIRPGAKAQPALVNVMMMLPGGPIRAASQTTLCSAARAALTATRTATEPVSAAAVSAIPVLATVPAATAASLRPRAGYGRPWP